MRLRVAVPLASDGKFPMIGNHRRLAVDVALVGTRNGFERRRLFQPREPIHLLVPVAESASDLLCHGDLALILKCENPRCILYFYDTTKNHARRWCSMTVCGNRMKVAAHYRRRRRTREHTLGGTGPAGGGTVGARRGSPGQAGDGRRRGTRRAGGGGAGG